MRRMVTEREYKRVEAEVLMDRFRVCPTQELSGGNDQNVYEKDSRREDHRRRL